MFSAWISSLVARLRGESPAPMVPTYRVEATDDGYVLLVTVGARGECLTLKLSPFEAASLSSSLAALTRHVGGHWLAHGVHRSKKR